MTHEQFVYWLSGFLSGMEYDPIKMPMSDYLREMIDKIKPAPSIFTSNSIKVPNSAWPPSNGGCMPL